LCVRGVSTPWLHVPCYADRILRKPAASNLVDQCRADRGSPYLLIPTDAPPHLTDQVQRGAASLTALLAQTGRQLIVLYSFNGEHLVQTLDRFDLPDPRNVDPTRPQ
jgi:hypothetical protein